VVLHVAKLLNWDEPLESLYGGWNPAAVAWWKRHLNSQPITPGLKYPALPLEITHGTESNATVGSDRIKDLVVVGLEPEHVRIISVSVSGPAQEPRPVVVIK
jgi:hypothetical protein